MDLDLSWVYVLTFVLTFIKYSNELRFLTEMQVLVRQQMNGVMFLGNLTSALGLCSEILYTTVNKIIFCLL